MTPAQTQQPAVVVVCDHCGTLIPLTVDLNGKTASCYRCCTCGQKYCLD